MLDLARRQVRELKAILKMDRQAPAWPALRNFVERIGSRKGRKEGPPGRLAILTAFRRAFPNERPFKKM